MTFFDKREIIDLIRHEIRIDDDTGIASRVIRPPTKYSVDDVAKRLFRRSKYGGLPLNFRISLSDDEEEEQEDFYTVRLIIPPVKMVRYLYMRRQAAHVTLLIHVSLLELTAAKATRRST